MKEQSGSSSANVISAPQPFWSRWSPCEMEQGIVQGEIWEQTADTRVGGTIQAFIDQLSDAC